MTESRAVIAPVLRSLPLLALWWRQWPTIAKVVPTKRSNWCELVKGLTRVSALANSGGVDEVAVAQNARQLSVDIRQFGSPLMCLRCSRLRTSLCRSHCQIDSISLDYALKRHRNSIIVMKRNVWFDLLLRQTQRGSGRQQSLAVMRRLWNSYRIL